MAHGICVTKIRCLIHGGECKRILLLCVSVGACFKEQQNQMCSPVRRLTNEWSFRHLVSLFQVVDDHAEFLTQVQGVLLPCFSWLECIELPVLISLTHS